MSPINTTLTPGFAVNGGAIDLERSPGNALAQSLTPIRLGGDNFASSMPAQKPNFVFGGFGGQDGGGFGGQNGLGGLGGILNSLLASLDSILSMLVGLFNSPQSGGVPQPQPPIQPYGGSPAPGQTGFTNATASSVGDPHESFNGTSTGGANVGGKWDSMTSHQNLLSSDSFDGGYRVSNSVTTPSDKGITQNGRVTVATDGGQTKVGMNANGSYDVTSFGRHVDLVAGQAVRLNENESVTLNADKSLTVNETNRNGGSIETTLRANGGGGVDVSNTAHDVDLGGYLVTKNDGGADPVAMAAGQYGSGSNTIAPYVGQRPAVTPQTELAAATSHRDRDDRGVDGTFAAESYEIEEA